MYNFTPPVEGSVPDGPRGKNCGICACVGAVYKVDVLYISVHSTGNSSVTRNEVRSGTRSCRRNPPWIAGFGIKQPVGRSRAKQMAGRSS